VGLVLTLIGCTIQHIPKEQSIEPARVPPFKVVGAVKLTNTQASIENMPIAVSPFTVNINYKNFTDLALKLLKNELDKKHAGGGTNAAKEIKLAIIDIKMLPMSGNFRCIINYTVETGDAYVRGLEAIGASWNYQTAIDAAIANVAVGVLNNERILTYLEK
jgi:hypothetical protein